jgi:hypothetical protein
MFQIASPKRPFVTGRNWPIAPFPFSTLLKSAPETSTEQYEYSKALDFFQINFELKLFHLIFV